MLDLYSVIRLELKNRKFRVHIFPFHSKPQEPRMIIVIILVLSVWWSLLPIHIIITRERNARNVFVEKTKVRLYHILEIFTATIDQMRLAA